jgi:hypothetical protein
VAVFDTAKFEHMQRVARLMAIAPVVPDHLKGKSPDEALGNCFAIVEQSTRWGMSPFAVAQATYFVHGKLGYEGKLIAAALDRMLGIKLDFSFDGSGLKRKITLWDPDAPTREISGTVEQWQTKGKEGKINQQWLNQPDDQLIYRGTRQWCRRYEPGVILGVYTPDELEAGEASEIHDITPLPTPPRIPPKAPAAAKPADPSPDAPEPLADQDGYIAHLEEQLAVVGNEAELKEAWDSHLETSDGRISHAHQGKAERLYEAAQKRIGGKTKPGGNGAGQAQLNV